MKPKQTTSYSAEIACSKRQQDILSVHKYANVNHPAGGNDTTKGVFNMIVWHVDDEGIFINPCSSVTVDPNIMYFLAPNNHFKYTDENSNAEP